MAGNKFRRIQTTIALAFTTLVLAIALIMVALSYSFTQDAVQRSARDYTAQLISQVQTNIDSYVDHMKNIAEVVQINEQVQRLLNIPGPPRPAEEEIVLRSHIAAFLNSISKTRQDISLILITGRQVSGRQGPVVTHDPTILLNDAVVIQEQNWFRAAEIRNGEAVVSSSHVQNIVDGEYRWVITLSRTINDSENGNELGVLLVDLNFSVINNLVNRISLGKKGYLFIIDSEGGIVYHPRQELIYSNLEREYIDRVLSSSDGSFIVQDDRGVRIYTVTTSGSTGWRTVGVNYASEMVSNRATIRRYYIYSTLLFVVIAVLLSILISHRLSRPIRRLRSTMRAVEQGNFDLSVTVSSNNEIGELAKDFNIMIAQIKELMQRNAEEHEQKRKSELLALQNQITPHFLYNTLDSVIWMAEGRQYSNVVTTVAALASLLRLSVSRGEEFITIRDEIEHIMNYLTIQKLRYRDKLDYAVDVDESIMRLRTPKVILQPLVENAIYHGIKNREGGGRVVVTGGRLEEEVILSVSDNGVGMSEERMRTLLDGPAEGPADGLKKEYHSHAPRKRARVGVRNVHERIQLYFGPGYGLSFRRNNGSGTIVDIRLPVRKGPAE